MIDLTEETPMAINAVAEKFGVHRHTVESWINSGLESCKLGGRRFTTIEAIQRFAEFDDLADGLGVTAHQMATIARREAKEQRRLRRDFDSERQYLEEYRKLKERCRA